MRFSILIICLLGFITAFAQPNREELALQDEEQFDLSFIFQYEDEAVFIVTFSREDKFDNFKIQNSECKTNGINYERPIVDRYVYEQLLTFLQDINITSFQPITNDQDEDAKLRVQGSISIPRTWTLNAFVFRHNPDNIGNESQILEYMVDILKDNTSDDCSKELTEQLSTYINGSD